MAIGDPETVVTPAMIAAGIDAYMVLDHEFDALERIVMDIYEAMEAARRSPKSSVSSDRRLTPISAWWQT
jgi:hypothetical protein